MARMDSFIIFTFILIVNIMDKRQFSLATIKKLTFLLFISFCNLQAQNIVWQKTIGGNDYDVLSRIKPTSDGGCIIAGYSKSVISGDKTENNINNSNDFWVVKLDSLGGLQWENTIGGYHEDYLMDVIETFDGGFLLGGTSKSDSSGDKTEGFCNPVADWGDYWIVKLNSAGNIVWQNTIGACSNDYFVTLEQLADGNYILGGTSTSNATCDKTENNTSATSSTPPCDEGSNDFWTVKIDTTGNILDQKTSGRSPHSSETLISISATIDGGYMCAGTSRVYYGGPNYGGYDNWIVELNTNCDFLGAKAIGGNKNDLSPIIKQLPDGSYICASSSNSDSSGLKTVGSYGLVDMWIYKLDTNANIMWQKDIGGSGNDYVNFIAPTFDNGFICGGPSNSPISGLKTSSGFGYSDYWILKLDSLGNIQWQRIYGGSGDDNFTTIHQTPNGNYIAAGYSDSNISGNKTENSRGKSDYWVLEIDDNSEYNLITGKTFFDYNGNNVKDSSDVNLPYQIIKEANTNHFAFTQADGSYHLSVPDTGTYQVSQHQSLVYLNSSPINHVATFSSLNQIDSLNDFATTQTVFINDLQVSITPVGPFRPGFNAWYNIEFKNVGTIPQQGTIVFYPDTNLTFLSSSVSPQAITMDSILWQTQILKPFQQGSINVYLNVHSSTQIGHWVNSSVKIEPLINDTNPSDNIASWNQFITGSYDPNEILVDRDSISTEELLASPALDYIIRFQNTGNDTAFTVKILNPIDTFKLDLVSFEIIAASHPFSLDYLSYEGNVEFKFENILLPDSTVDELKSHGYVRYRIRPKTTIQVHDSISNYAAIYFDYNLPVITNKAITRIVYPDNFVEMYTTVCDSLISPSGNYTWNSNGLYFDTIPGGTSGVDSVYVIHLNIGTSFGSLNATSCNSYVSPSGKFMWSVSGVYSDTLTNSIGCDSIITINLAINHSSSSTISISECNQYSSPSGKYVWTSSGTYYDTIPNFQGCDSILFINLTINNSSDSTIFTSACDNYLSPSGNFIWSTSGTYTDSILTSHGCDSVITINLTIIPRSNAVLTVSSCETFTSPSTNYVWNSSGVYYDTIPNVMGCDSIIVINLTVINNSSSTQYISECNSYISPSGLHVWTTSGNYLDTISNSIGCDSIININLILNTVDSSVSVVPPLLTANAIGANYQWIFCDSSIIQGEVSQNFLATTNGSYAVIITQNGCIDTSSCYSVTNVGVNENEYSDVFRVFPNPSSDKLTISFESFIISGRILISNALGNFIYSGDVSNNSKIEINVESFSDGIYFIWVFDGERCCCKKLMITHN